MTDQMKQMVWLSIAVVLAVALAFSMGGASQAQDLTINTRVGLVNGYDNAEAARNSGAGWEIVYFRWDELQPAGPSDWNVDGPTGDYVGSAQSLGREIVPVLVGTPAWATNDIPGIGIPTGLYLPATDPGNLWAGFVRQAVSYYATQGINHWAIWDDMDIPEARAGATWAGSEEDYYQLIKVAYTVAKDANPNAVIHVGGIGSFDSTWFNRFLDVAIADETGAENNYYFDIASLNMYFAPDRVGTQTANLFFVMGQKGMALKPVWLNKINARPAVDAAYPDDATFREFQRVTVEQQANFIVQAYAEGFAAGADRIATYRLVDNLADDEQQAYGLVRADGTTRPAFTAFQIVAEYINGFVFARNVNEEANPLMDYVRLTAADKVTHIVWARTEDNATIIIPARSESATLVDINNNQWQITPEDGVNYRIAVEGAVCNEPSAPAGCLIGGAPWILIEEGVANALSEVPPNINVVEGGTPPTPDPSFALTATARALPTPTPTVAPTETTAPEVPAPTEGEGEAAEVATTLPPPPVEATQIPVEEEQVQPTEPPPPTPEPTPAFLPGEPHGLITAVPFVLIVLGVLVIGGGATFYLTDGFETLNLDMLRRGGDSSDEGASSEDEIDWDSVVDDEEDWVAEDEYVDEADYDEGDVSDDYEESDGADTYDEDEGDDS